ncbi:MAG: hypothetical protein R3F62_29085 [Planctomycetota bacterium]
MALSLAEVDPKRLILLLEASLRAPQALVDSDPVDDLCQRLLRLRSEAALGEHALAQLAALLSRRSSPPVTEALALLDDLEARGLGVPALRLYAAGAALNLRDAQRALELLPSRWVARLPLAQRRVALQLRLLAHRALLGREADAYLADALVIRKLGVQDSEHLAWAYVARAGWTQAAHELERLESLPAGAVPERSLSALRAAIEARVSELPPPTVTSVLFAGLGDTTTVGTPEAPDRRLFDQGAGELRALPPSQHPSAAQALLARARSLRALAAQLELPEAELRAACLPRLQDELEHLLRDRPFSTDDPSLMLLLRFLVELTEDGTSAGRLAFWTLCYGLFLAPEALFHGPELRAVLARLEEDVAAVGDPPQHTLPLLALARLWLKEDATRPARIRALLERVLRGAPAPDADGRRLLARHAYRFAQVAGYLDDPSLILRFLPPGWEQDAPAEYRAPGLLLRAQALRAQGDAAAHFAQLDALEAEGVDVVLVRAWGAVQFARWDEAQASADALAERPAGARSDAELEALRAAIQTRDPTAAPRVRLHACQDPACRYEGRE